MNQTVLCPRCRGQKKVNSLGGIMQNCEECKGIGSIVSIERKEIIPEQTIKPLPPSKKEKLLRNKATFTLAHKVQQRKDLLRAVKLNKEIGEPIVERIRTEEERECGIFPLKP